jgi:hypothetical protein
MLNIYHVYLFLVLTVFFFVFCLKHKKGASSGPRVISTPLNEDAANVNAAGQDSRIWFLASGLGGNIILVCIRGQGEPVGIPTNYKGKNVWNCPSLHCDVYARNGQVTDPVDTAWLRQGDLQGNSLFLGVNYPFLLDAPEPEAGNAGNTFPLFKPDSVFAAPNYVNHIPRFPDWCRIPVDGGASVGSTFVWPELNWGEFHEVPMWFVPTLPWPDM